MREKSIEQKLVLEVSKRGGLCWKFTSPGTAGVPDWKPRYQKASSARE